MNAPGWTVRGVGGALAALVFGLIVGRGVAGPASGKPDYPHGKFEQDCRLCHTGDSWSPAVVSKEWKHPSAFPLEGAHAFTPCQACHDTLDFTVRALSGCATCHLDPHQGELGQDCARCHTFRSFTDRARMVTEHQLTRFPLMGMHAALDCAECHAISASGAPAFVNTPLECFACHADDMRAVRDPDHGGFSTECTRCHGVTSWAGAAFNHAATAFPLTGAHLALDCVTCHVGGVFSALDPACASCHREDYDGTTDPVHAAAGFPTECDLCHGTASWEGAAFDHAGTAFPLTGAHTALECMSCHAQGVYDGLSTECVFCHRDDYDGTQNPAHASAGFSTECASCHGTATWEGATFDHDGSFFPIYSGRHRGRWNECVDCHVSPTDFATFSCLTCHPHSDAQETNSHHNEVNGYSYESRECYRCHPRGEAD